MKVAIICESMFGNTEQLADAVRQGLAEAGAETAVFPVGLAYASSVALDSYQLVVVAAPTHALTLSRPESRSEAVTRGAPSDRAEIGIREWLGTVDTVMPLGRSRPLIAIFDSRIALARHWPGSAARRAERTLRREGFTILSRTSFYVEAITGPLSDGEPERATEWGRSLVARVHEAACLDGVDPGHHLA